CGISFSFAALKLLRKLPPAIREQSAQNHRHHRRYQNMHTWYEKAVFYHMYPLGMTGAPKQNTQEEPSRRFEELNQWIPHIRSLGCTAIYIGPLFESSTHGYDTRDYKL